MRGLQWPVADYRDVLRVRRVGLQRNTRAAGILGQSR